MSKKEMNIGEMLKGLLEAAAESQEPKTQKVRVGRVSRAMVERVREIDERHDRQHDELNDKIEAFKEDLAKEAAARMKAFVDQVEREHRPDCRKASEEMAAAWDDIHDELGLPESERATNYNLNAITGDVTKEVPLQESDDDRPMTEKVLH